MVLCEKQYGEDMSVAHLQTHRPPKPPMNAFFMSIGIGERRLRKLKGECHDQPYRQ
jgi:hypothetical protein